MGRNRESDMSVTAVKPAGDRRLSAAPLHLDLHNVLDFLNPPGPPGTVSSDRTLVGPEPDTVSFCMTH